MRIEEVASTSKTQRVATHTHIKGLGVQDDGTAIPMAAGFVGQEQAREACGVVVDMIKQKVREGCMHCGSMAHACTFGSRAQHVDRNGHKHALYEHVCNGAAGLASHPSAWLRDCICRKWQGERCCSLARLVQAKQHLPWALHRSLAQR